MKTFSVTPGSELDKVLDEAAAGPVLIERDGARFRLSREPDEDIWAGYDPEAVRKALAETAGSWADLDTDKMIEDIYRWREEGFRPANRP
jgi:hypothetical protein